MMKAQEIARYARAIDDLLRQRGIRASVCEAHVQTRMLTFVVRPEFGQPVDALPRLANDLAAALAADNVTVLRRGSMVHVTMPNPEARPLLLRELLDNLHAVPANTCMSVLGSTDDGAPLLLRLTSPDVAHVLVAGTTGSGKTALLRTIAASLAYYTSSAAMRMVAVGVRLRCLNAIPHIAKAVIEDETIAVQTLAGLVRLMEQRDRENQSEPRIIVIIDELADMMMIGGAEAEYNMTRLLQRGRGVGIHIIAATQKPTAAVIGSLVKANFPVRLVGKVASADDALVAAGQRGSGAERLSGRGDFIAVAEGRLHRFQAAFISEDEMNDLVYADDKHARPFALEIPRAVNCITFPSPQLDDAREVEIAEMARRLRGSGWKRGDSLRAACRALGEAEGGRRFDLVREAARRVAS
jgi:S-DNA-T family DNA segregation ATPase FtsK/SpoIIIE